MRLTKDDDISQVQTIGSMTCLAETMGLPDWLQEQSWWTFPVLSQAAGHIVLEMLNWEQELV